MLCFAQHSPAAVVCTKQLREEMLQQQEHKRQELRMLSESNDRLQSHEKELLVYVRFSTAVVAALRNSFAGSHALRESDLLTNGCSCPVARCATSPARCAPNGPPEGRRNTRECAPGAQRSGMNTTQRLSSTLCVRASIENGPHCVNVQPTTRLWKIRVSQTLSKPSSSKPKRLVSKCTCWYAFFVHEHSLL